jgi:hypothetical protein
MLTFCPILKKQNKHIASNMLPSLVWHVSASNLCTGCYCRAHSEEPHLQAARRLQAREKDQEAVHPPEGVSGVQLHRADHRAPRKHTEAHGEGDRVQDCNPGQGVCEGGALAGETSILS